MFTAYSCFRLLTYCMITLASGGMISLNVYISWLNHLLNLCSKLQYMFWALLKTTGCNSILFFCLLYEFNFQLALLSSSAHLLWHYSVSLFGCLTEKHAQIPAILIKTTNNVLRLKSMIGLVQQISKISHSEGNFAHRQFSVLAGHLHTSVCLLWW